MAQAIPPGEFVAIEGEMRLRCLGDQVAVEMESSESWYACLTFNEIELEKISEWLTLRRLARK